VLFFTFSPWFSAIVDEFAIEISPLGASWFSAIVDEFAIEISPLGILPPHLGIDSWLTV
jgi:hypothetical protein